MRTLSEINFNYDRAIQQAERLDTVSARLGRVAGEDMEDILNGVYQAWRSASSAGYLRKAQKVETDLQTASDNLKKIANSIRAIAEQVREAELEARRIANEKNA